MWRGQLLRYTSLQAIYVDQRFAQNLKTFHEINYKDICKKQCREIETKEPVQSVMFYFLR